MHWSFRPAGGPSLLASFLSVILSLLGIDVFVLSSLYHLGRALLRDREIDYTVMVWWLWYDIDDDSFIERLRCRAIECQRRHWFDVHRSGPWPYYSRSLYTRVLQTKTKSFKPALQVRLDEDDLFRHWPPCNIESRVISLLRDTDTATHCYRPLVYQVGLTRTSRRGQSLSIEAMRLALATLISNLVASHRWRDKDTAYRIVILVLWRIRIERIYIFTDVD